MTEPDELVRFSQWITPAQVKIRFDTHFFLAPLPAGAEPAIDGEEIVDLGWFAPGDALEAYGRGELQLVFPTIKQLEALLEYATVEQALTAARSQTVEPILPRFTVVDGEPQVLLPGDPGYEQAQRQI